ncbi:MAG: hypothetical protein U0350_09385 [Caldilineaceae bacterium]
MLIQLLLYLVASVLLGIALTFKFLIWLANPHRNEDSDRVAGCLETLLFMVPLSVAIVFYLVAVLSNT